MIYGERTNRTAFHVRRDGTATKMRRVPFMTGEFNEAWLQNLVEENPAILPAGEVGIEYAPLVCIGTEVSVGSGDSRGCIDNLYVTPSGHIVIVETKLFRNQESRRAVVAQIIDYAKELQQWDADMLGSVAESYFYKKTGQASRIIDEMVRRGYLSFSDEGALTDAINMHLMEASFLLLVVGDGIRSNVYQLAEFLNENTAMTFNLALVEIETYASEDGYICVPNLLTKSTVIERRAMPSTLSVFKGGSVMPTVRTIYQPKPLLSRGDFIEAFADNGGLDPDELSEFISDMEAVDGLFVTIAPTELSIKFSIDNDPCTLLSFGISGGHADLWLTPSRIQDFLKSHDVFPFDAEPLLAFYKSYIDSRRCKHRPYEKLDSFYYADVHLVLDNAEQFIASAEKFVTTISNRD